MTENSRHRVSCRPW